ncbi:MAG: nucleotidyltransferase domain-containing protein [Methylococcales bacterium]
MNESMSLPDDDKIRQLQIELEKDPEISLAILFGSYAGGTIRPESDIDLAIKLNTPLVEEKKIQIIERVAQISGRAVDLVDLQRVGEPLLSQIIEYGKVIKGRRHDFTEMAIRNVYANEDFLPYIKRSLQARRERWIK